MSLRFHDVDADEITRVLGVSSNIVARSPNLWLHQVPAREPGEFDGQIAELLNLVTADIAAWRWLTRRHRADIFCGAFFAGGNAGFSLSPATLQLLAERGLSLDLDVYDTSSGE